MTSKTTIAAIAAGLLAIGGGKAHAVDFTPEKYDADQLCFAKTYEYLVEGTGVDGVWTDDFIRPDDWPILNSGSTSMTLDYCIPTDCPDPYELVSGNVCRLSENMPVSSTMGFIPNYDQNGDPIAPESTIDVGPLVEPAIATVAS